MIDLWGCNNCTTFILKKEKINKNAEQSKESFCIKKLLTNYEIKLIEARSNQEEIENSNNFQKEFKPRSNGVQKINNGEKSLPIFKNNSEKYEYLIKHNPSDTWIAKFKQTKEYKLLYE